MNVRVQGRLKPFRTVTFDEQKNSVQLIEQRLLPHEFKIVGTRDFRETAAAIRGHDRARRRRHRRHRGLRTCPGRPRVFADAIAENFRTLATSYETLKAARPDRRRSG